jgi:transglycosylase-like protein with SLT domain
MGRWYGIVLFAVVTGCGFFRDVPVEAPVALPETGLPESALSHPKTLAWARRFCAKLARHPAEELGLVPSRPILPRMRAILVEQGLPRELVAVPAIESGYQVNARGDHGELGLWQLQPATARRFGLEVNRAHDERAHVDRSTWAAARYLAFLHDRYEDWPLALAAYNAGEGRVDRALVRRPGATFWDLAARGALPQISREYVPKILAVVRLTNAPDECNDGIVGATARPRSAEQNRAG